MSVLFTDSGTGTNANPIGGSYVTLTGIGALRRVSNQIANAAGSDTDSGAYINITTPNDHYTKMTPAVVGGRDGGPMVRCQTGACSGVLITDYNATDVEAYVLVGGSFGSFVDRDTGTYQTTSVVYLEAQGTTYISKIDATTVNNFTDATFSSGKGGLFMYDGTQRYINIEVGDFVTGQNLSPSAVSSAVTLGSHTVSKNTPQSLAPTAVASAVTLGSHTVVHSDRTLLPTAVASAATFGSHTVVKMSFILPTAIASAVAFGSHTIVKDVTSSGIPSAAVYGSQTVAKDGQTIQVTGVASAVAFGSHTLSQTGQTLLPTAIGTAAVYGSHMVADVNLQIAPNGIASAVAYGAHLVATAGTQTVTTTGIGTATAYGSQTVANTTPQALSPTAIASAAVYGSNMIGLVLETIIVPGIGTAGQVGRPTLIGGISPTEFYIGSSNVTIDDRVEEDRPIGAGNVQQPLGDLE